MFLDVFGLYEVAKREVRLVKLVICDSDIRYLWDPSFAKDNNTSSSSSSSSSGGSGSSRSSCRDHGSDSETVGLGEDDDGDWGDGPDGPTSSRGGRGQESLFPGRHNRKMRRGIGRLLPYIQKKFLKGTNPQTSSQRFFRGVKFELLKIISCSRSCSCLVFPITFGSKDHHCFYVTPLDY